MQRQLRPTRAAMPGLFGALLLGCSAQGPPDSNFADLPSHRLAPIVGGETTLEFAEIAALYWSDTFQCSAVLIGADTLLTAAHCLYPFPDESGLEVRFGPEPDESTAGIEVASFLLHPDFATDATHDLARLQLSQTAPWPPVSWNPDPLNDDDVGSPLTLVAYGRASPDDATAPTRRRAEVLLDELLPTTLNWTDLDRGVCDGDSGGAAYIDLGAGPVVVGLLREGDPGCIGWGAATRTDPFASWIETGSNSDVPEGSFDNDATTPDGAETGCSCSSATWNGQGAGAILAALATLLGIGWRRRPTQHLGPVATCLRPQPRPLRPDAGPLRP